ncbi:MAG: hypothetical protein GY853_13505 [PVC group bacterium]|nr:hypothetical protein [PVC group bacterium]
MITVCVVCHNIITKTSSAVKQSTIPPLCNQHCKNAYKEVYCKDWSKGKIMPELSYRHAEIEKLKPEDRFPILPYYEDTSWEEDEKHQRRTIYTFFYKPLDDLTKWRKHFIECDVPFLVKKHVESGISDNGETISWSWYVMWRKNRALSDYATAKMQKQARGAAA